MRKSSRVEEKSHRRYFFSCAKHVIDLPARSPALESRPPRLESVSRGWTLKYDCWFLTLRWLCDVEVALGTGVALDQHQGTMSHP